MAAVLSEYYGEGRYLGRYATVTGMVENTQSECIRMASKLKSVIYRVIMSGMPRTVLKTTCLAYFEVCRRAIWGQGLWNSRSRWVSNHQT